MTILRSWPRVLAASTALIPVLLLIFMIATIAVRGAPAALGSSASPAGGERLVNDSHIGLRELFSTTFANAHISGVGRYGLTPALWGTVELVVVALALAVPASLAIAVCAGELAPGLIGSALRGALGLMSGIPPIVYALAAVVFVAPFMIPKFTGNLSYSSVDPTKVGVSPDRWPPVGVPWNAGAFPWNASGESSSVLLGGILLAMLAIPFVAPLIDDAIRNVPSEPKEASLALGASTWHTLMHVTLPHALAGIISAVRLGTLKVLGDVMIGLFVIGVSAVSMPNPLWDVLERTAPLSAEGAGLIGGFQTEARSCTSADCAAGYFSALVLLLLAFLIVLLTMAAERYVRRKQSV